MRRRGAQIGPGMWSLNRDQPRSTTRDDRHGERSALEALAARRAVKHAAALIASIQDGLFVVDESGRIADVNARFVEMTGFGRHELIGQSFPYPFWATEDRDANAIAFQQFLAMLRQAGTPSADLELASRSKGGRRFPVTMRVAQLFGAAKELVGYVGTVKDVTSLRRAEHELRSSQAQARAEQGALKRVATAIARGAVEGAIFAHLAHEVAALTQCDTAAVYRFEGRQMILVGSHGVTAHTVGASFALRGDDAVPQAARTGQPARVADYRSLRADDPANVRHVHPSCRAGAAVPIAVGDRRWGAILIATTHEKPIPPDAEAALLRFSSLAAIAISRVDARVGLEAPVLCDPVDALAFDPLVSADEQVSKTRRRQAHGGSLTLLRTIDSRDPGTLRRSEFVAEIAKRLALELGWAPKRASDLYEAGLVHKVGKMGLSDAILFKPAPMTSAERAQMERHPVLGAEVLAGSLSEEQVTWVRHHHESFDGTGYPDGLKGDRIPDGARILALADAWDAMTNGRDRQSARDHADALADCQRQASRSFCPRAVDALVRIMSPAEPSSAAGPVARLDA